MAAKNPEFYFFSVLIYPEEEESDSDEEMELHPLLTASLRTPITSKKKDIPPLGPPPLPPGWTAVNPGNIIVNSVSFVSTGTFNHVFPSLPMHTLLSSKFPREI